MPPKNHKKAIANARAPTQGRVGQRKNAAEVITDSGDEFEHLTVDAEDSIDEKEVIEISDDEMEGEDDDELAPTPRSHRTGPPSTPSPVKASGKKRVIPIANRDEEMTCIPSPTPNSPKKASAKVSSTPVNIAGKKRAIVTINSGDEDEVNAPSPEYVTPKKARTKEPSTPSKSIRSASGKKRAVATADSDNEDVFVLSPVHDSPKKARVKEPSTSSKTVKNSGRQLVFDKAVSDATTSSAPTPKEKTKKVVKKASSKSDPPKIELTKKTVHLSDIEMEKVFLPSLKNCQIFSKKLVDRLLADTYAELPKLPRMADFSSTWGPRCEQGGYKFSQIKSLYKSPDMEYIKALITFSHDKVGTIGNLSRINPRLLGVKDANHFNKNMIHLRGSPSVPLLCFSVIITTIDNHMEGRTFGPSNEWIVKDIGGVFPTMELERAIAVIGLAFKMPYVPADSARTTFDVLHFTMDENAFSFSTSMMKEADYRRDLAAAEGSKSQSSTRVVKKGLFAPASPALSSEISPSAGARKPSLRPLETVPIYDGRKRQLKVPDDLRNVPGILSRYPGEIPYHSLVLVAYTVSLYRAAHGSRKDQPTVPLNISFAVVLHDKPLESKGGDGGEGAKDDDATEDEPPQYQSGEEVEDQDAEEVEDQNSEEVEDENAEEAEDQSAEEAEDQSDAEVDLSDAAEEQSDDE